MGLDAAQHVVRLEAVHLPPQPISLKAGGKIETKCVLHVGSTAKCVTLNQWCRAHIFCAHFCPGSCRPRGDLHEERDGDAALEALRQEGAVPEEHPREGDDL